MKNWNSMTNEERDALVAEKVMGYQRVEGSWDWKLNKVGQGTVTGPLPKFVTDIRDAQEVVKKVQSKSFMIQITNQNGVIFCEIIRASLSDTILESGVTESEVICKAALKAFGILI